MREKAIESYLVREAKKRDYILSCDKFKSENKRGVPDRIILADEGLVIFVEVKNEKGILSKLQERWIKDARRFQQLVTVVYNKQQVDELMMDIEQLIKERKDANI